MTSGNGHQQTIQFTKPPQRVVSLVPSMTESFFDLGLGNSLVGITDYCIHPQEKIAQVPHVGGPKDPDIEKIIRLQPDLVVVNQEENPISVVDALESVGIKVWVTFPRTARQALDILWALVGIYQNRTAAVRLETLEITLDWAESALHNREVWDYFCPIWMEVSVQKDIPSWWMTFNQDTYMNDVLRLMGGKNVFSVRNRKYPLEADLGIKEPEDPGIHDVRYPRVTAGEILALDPQVILLPDEPYHFAEKDREFIDDSFRETRAVKNDKVFYLSGSLLAWHGTRLARALNDLPLVLGEL